MTGAWIIGGILLPLVLILALPVGLDIRYQEKVSGAVTLMGLPIVRFPETRTKPERKISQPEEATEKPTKRKKEKKQKTNFIQELSAQEGISGVVGFLERITRILGELTARLGRKLWLQYGDIRVTVGGANPASTAVAYGKLCAAFYPAVGALLSLLNYRSYRAEIVIDYFKRRTEAQVHLIFRISVGAILLAVLRAGISFLKLLIKIKRKEASQCQTKVPRT